MTELEITLLLCSFLSGADVETGHEFTNFGRARGIRIDCETPTHVVEVGYDGRSSRDSVHQAVFASALTGKTPYVVLIDSDGVEGRYEQEMRIVTARLGIGYARCAEDFIVRWSMTREFRLLGNDKTADDLPREASARSLCDLRALLGG